MRLARLAQRAALPAMALISAQTACAQRTDDNAVTEAEDAFGKSVGGEEIGIYNAYDVRGFSPVSAGNVRVEGLYFDQQSDLTDRLIDGTTVHVGISAQGYPFPAPTGIADNSLRKPGNKFVTSLAAVYGPFGGVSGEVDVQVPIDGERLGLIAGMGLYREGTPYGGTPKFTSYAISPRWAPDKNTSVQPFWSRISVRDDESQSFIFPSGDYLPPRYKRGEFYGQKWADFVSDIDAYGVVAKTRLAGFDLGLGVFRQTVDVKQDHVELMFDTDRSGRVGDRLVVADRDNWFASTSGEFKLSRDWREGPRRHLLHAMVRGRSLERRYGGSDLISLGTSQLGVEDFRSRPVSVYGDKTRDTVRQKTAGLGYELRWKGLGEISLGVQKTDYTKRVLDPVAGLLPATKDSPWLYSATAAVHLAKRLALYGGYTRGMEESDSAPENAVNRNEAPPAIRTTQKDFGMRWGISDKLSLVAGWFDVKKPYFNVDTALRFRQLGSIHNHGLETSLSGQVAPGLTLVAGAVWLNSHIHGEEVDSGAIGRRPIGTFKLHTLAFANWVVPWHKKLTLTARFESTSDRIANTLNTLEIPDRWVASLGARYKTKVSGKPILIRANMDNIFNTFGWNTTGGGAFLPNGSRRWSLTVAADI